MKLIRYVGAKPQKIDNVAGTGAVWYGYGDVVEVPDYAVEKLLEHPKVWELTGLEGPRFSVKVGAGAKEQVFNLDIMNDQEMRSMVRVYGIRGVTMTLRGDNLRRAITLAVNPPPPKPPPEPPAPPAPDPLEPASEPAPVQPKPPKEDQGD